MRGILAFNAALVVLLAGFNALVLGRASVLLSAGLAVSFLVWGLGRWQTGPRVTRLYAAMLVLFVIHVAEEAAAGFPAAWPALFGEPPWSVARFLQFNAVWLAVFVVVLIVLARRGSSVIASRSAAMIVIFMALVGGLGNGIVHASLSMARASYFPGTASGLLMPVAGALLLRAMTARRAASASPGPLTAWVTGRLDEQGR